MTTRSHVREGIGVLASVLLLFLCTLPLAAQTGRISGQVTNATTGGPVSGAQIVVQGTQIGTISNAQGRYLLLNTPVGTHTIEVTRLGFSRASASVTVGVDETAILDFQLTTEAISLDEVVVTGTAGSARRREIGNSVGVITSDDLEAMPIASTSELLQGRTAGLTIRQGDGAPGSGAEIMLRGVNTLGGPSSNRPLIYVDGVRLETGGHQHPDEANVSTTMFDDLDAGSIERIEVIKGAAATTLYGTEAAGGVIQVFTKGGGGGAPQWTATINQGFTSIGHVGPEEDPTGMHVNDCTMDPGCPESGSWVKLGYIQNYELSVRGGTDVPWYVAATFGDQTGNMDPQAAQNMSFRANFRFEPLENVSIRASNMFTRRDITFVPNGNNAEGMLLNIMRWERDYSPGHDDSAILDMDLRQQIDHFITGLNITWTPSANLSQRLNLGLDYSSSDYTEERPWGFFYRPEGERENDLALDRNITFDYAGTWSADIPWGNTLTSNFSWGAQYYDQFSWGINGFGEQFSGPGEKILQSGVITEAFEGWLRTASGGFFLQQQFGWQDRAFITLGARWDGFSTFGENFGLAFYPKISGAYTISDHEFWPSFWEAMKLRFAVGESGRAPGPFASKRTWASTSGDDLNPAVILSELGNEDVGPERTREYEGGFEGSLFQGRLALDFTYFYQETFDALLRLDRPTSIGTEQAILTNLGKVENKGFELTANATLYSGRDISWDLGGNFYTGEDAIVSLGPVTDERLKDRPVSAQFGDCVTNPDAVGERPDFEECYLGPARPTTTFGINTSVTLFRSLTLDALGEFQGGHVRQNGTARQNVRRSFWAPCQQIIDDVEAGTWSQYTAAELAKCSPRDANYGPWTMKSDFFKIRSVSASWRVPEQFLMGGIQGMTLRMQARNIFEWTKFEDGPAEGNEDGANAGWYWSTRWYYNLPVPSTYMFSASVNF